MKPDVPSVSLRLFVVLRVHDHYACRHRVNTRQSPLRMTRTTLRIVDSLAAVPASAWDALVGDRPLLSHAFLHALHESRCAAPETGWTPRYLTAWRSDVLV